MNKDTIDTTNKFFVSISGNGQQIVIMRPMHQMSRGDALNLAAWIVALVDGKDEFDLLLHAVQRT